jgi:hypothetical protein
MSDAMLQRLAAECAERHRIPKATVTHPAVIVPGDEFMTEKLRDPDYVPYCFGTNCGRTRRTEFGFQCPTCGNKMNYDLRHYDGNKDVQYVGAAPSPKVATSGLPPAPLEWVNKVRGTASAKLAARRIQHNDITAWNANVEARKAARADRRNAKRWGA